MTRRSVPSEDDNPTVEIAAWVDELLARNDYTRGAKTGEMYLGRDVLVITLRRPVVIEGQWEDTARTADLFDLMDEHRCAAGREDNRDL